jgi:hypothetical protein
MKIQYGKRASLCKKAYEIKTFWRIQIDKTVFDVMTSRQNVRVPFLNRQKGEMDLIFIMKNSIPLIQLVRDHCPML